MAEEVEASHEQDRINAHRPVHLEHFARFNKELLHGILGNGTETAQALLFHKLGRFREKSTDNGSEERKTSTKVKEQFPFALAIARLVGPAEIYGSSD